MAVARNNLFGQDSIPLQRRRQSRLDIKEGPCRLLVSNAPPRRRNHLPSFVQDLRPTVQQVHPSSAHHRTAGKKKTFDLVQLLPLSVTNFSFFQFQFQSPDYLIPLWYPEEIENAVRSLSVAVIDSYYGGCSPVGRKPIKRIRVDNSNNIRNRLGLAPLHDPIRCQACHHGLCVASGFFN